MVHRIHVLELTYPYIPLLLAASAESEIAEPGDQGACLRGLITLLCMLIN